MFKIKESQEVAELKKKVDELDKLLRQAYENIAYLAKEIDDIKKPKDPNYFG
jgi:prefoldin subunit 5